MIKLFSYHFFVSTQTEYQQVAKVVPMSDVFYCKICMKNLPNSNGFTVNSCSHTFCIECVTQHLLIKITEGVANIRCPDLTRKEGIFDLDMCQKILEPKIIDHWGILMSESTIGSNKLKCHFQDCSGLLTDKTDHHGGKLMVKRRCVFLGIPCRCAIKKKEIPEATMSTCPHCNRHLCVRCGVPWHDRFSCHFLELQRLACCRS